MARLRTRARSVSPSRGSPRQSQPKRAEAIKPTSKSSVPSLPRSSATAAFITVLPLTALAVEAALLWFPAFVSNPTIAAQTAVAIMTFVVYAIYRSVIALGHKPTLLNVFLCVSTFTAACDLGITGYLVGVWPLGSFYPKHGERYFLSSYGVACLGWDGIFHTSIQGVLAYRALHGHHLKPAGLVWAGSVIFSMMPLLLGSAATGKFSDGVELSTAMNAPYVIIPVALAVQLFKTHDARGGSSISSPSQFLAVVAAVSHCALALTHTVQIMAVLGSKANVATWWIEDVEPVLKQKDGTNAVLIGIVQFFFYGVIYHCFAVWEWVSRASTGRFSMLGENAADWSALVFGAYLQGVFVQTFMGTVTFAGPGELSFTAHWPQLGIAFCTLTASAFQLCAFLLQ